MTFNALDATALAQLFTEARTHNKLDGEITDAQLQEIYELTKFGPTAANGSPARFVFVKSAEAKKLLEPALDEGNREKTMASPVTVIAAYDMDFHEKLPQLFPHTNAKAWFEGERDNRFIPAFRNGTLQAGYFIMAARAMGLDCGPMSGFNNAMVDEAFFKGTHIRSNFLINLGKGDPSAIFARSPRLRFDEACKIA
ncbi:malonic semialdehyde reductase [Lysobacter soyae]|uniref:Putative NADH dehydrogenase/NAD(P)H nitroreductase H8L67_09605 n=1 Tax=Lysobacter soyae TaxID=2764185 RepID=A0ABX8WN21_9GAMM|nr:malonic semialdehyde reductase [Lysobacter sp. CJ11]QYR52813.1 malonic semialdehyde reductase [Lysobacter sp. CJ11]